MTDTGNAVVAEWVGPAGMQLFDGTLLEPGVVISGVGYDEAHGSDYWKVLGDADSFSGDSAGDASSRIGDPSFGTEEGGGSTGRPLTDDQVQEAKDVKKSSRSKASDPADTVVSPDPVPASGGTE